MLGLQPATRQAQMGWILEELSLSSCFYAARSRGKEIIKPRSISSRTA